MAAVHNKTTPSDPKTAIIVKAIKGQKGVPAEVLYAWESYDQEDIRIILDALLLGDAPLSLICSTTKIPVDVLQAYSEYFFDISVFRNQLQRYSYVNSIRNHVTPQEASMLQSVINGGPEMLVWLLSPGKKTPKHAPIEVLEIMMTENMYKALAGRTAPLGSIEAKVSLEASKTAIQAAANLQKLNPADDVDALAELKLALTHQDTSINANTVGAPRPEDILH